MRISIQGMGACEMPGEMFRFAVMVSLGAGCAPLQSSGCYKTSAIGSCSSGRWDDRD